MTEEDYELDLNNLKNEDFKIVDDDGTPSEPIVSKPNRKEVSETDKAIGKQIIKDAIAESIKMSCKVSCNANVEVIFTKPTEEDLKMSLTGQVKMVTRINRATRQACVVIPEVDQIYLCPKNAVMTIYQVTEQIVKELGEA